MNFKSQLYACCFFMLICGNLTAQYHNKAQKQQEELGKVNWIRDFDQAKIMSQKEGKDILILFQEVPGCATCRNYGHNVLSHPLMVEAIENLFIPLVIFNNKKGNDLKVLKKYGEPSWNNPVVRIVDYNGKNIVNRIGDNYEALTLCKRMRKALLTQNKIIPEYLNMLELELLALNNDRIKEQKFKMYCFWNGEKKLGNLNGVLSTKSGFSNHNEVVKVTYNTDIIKEDELIHYAKSQNFNLVDKHSFKLSEKDLHYYLQHSDFKYIPLTEVQKTKINSALGNQKSAIIYLSPKQKKWFNQLNKNKATTVLNTTFKTAWEKLEKNN